MDETNKNIAEKVNFEPKCLTNEKALAITNDGFVLPCCECDFDKEHIQSTPTYRAMKLASRLYDHDSIEDVVSQQEWIDFANELKQGIAPKWCYYICSKSNLKVQMFHLEDQTFFISDGSEQPNKMD